MDDDVLAALVPYGGAINSICDPVSEGGSPFGETSIFNESSDYGGLFGASSPFNPEAPTPPRIILDGIVMGHLSVSAAATDPVDPFDLLAWLGCPLSPI